MESNYQILWDECLKVIKDNVSESAFSTWFLPVVPLQYKKRELTIQVPSQFFYEYLEEQYVDLLHATLSKVIGHGTILNYRVIVDNSSNAHTTLQSETKTLFAERKTLKDANKTPKLFSATSAVHEWNPNLNPRYNFDNYFEGESNKLSRTVAATISKNPGNTAFNPLFIHGNSGVGKTHLCHAIGNKICEFHPGRKVLYISSHLFKVQFMDATRNNSSNDFINFYQGVDVLILDDIQELSGLTATQNTYFHIFNHLHQLGKQIILTSDKLPKDLQGLEDRLISRLKWGVTTELHRPDLSLRKKILTHKILHDGLVISKEIVDYIAENVTEHVRDLEGIITSLVAYSLVYNREVDLELAKRVVSQSIKIEEKKITIEKIQDVVSGFYKIELRDIHSKSRKQEIVQARHLSMFLSKKYTGFSYSHIGLKIGNRDHATVLHACKTVQDAIDTNKSFRIQVEEIESKLKH
ncbi:MAG: chromosomal replication initiator protein DnaA [Dysgonamonadaceae bacterium]|nr:chromosomal replication initiator protein DnaA [Dysgonamonadaceae bacterium]